MQSVIEVASTWILPLVIAGILVAGAVRRIPLYNTFVDGAKGGFGTSVRLIPHVVAMMVAVSVFRASGAMDLIVNWVHPVAAWFHIPSQVVPMALLRPISNAGSLALLTDLFQQPHHGPDSFAGLLASTMQASTDTTLYIITVYFGSVGIERFRYALTVGLLSDLASVVGSVVAVWLLHPSLF
ncbi:spore maturation protein [Alicyclobacillus cycloheptanicus]|uniref:Spore maturation protein B n=1 Tax=Alicyclobacillus cycloheptanicus TaxID=1457 RepID=A0ABT9XEP9_9BACL|nr:nucleoside recognition domain-containing protein [Alicyclobacillus cycloheptanicus]MDQ0188774.1 spore maturation protein B [Alicyclobacillus cycloheptanicus]WDM00569.1 spore maturation protein [Alicyclobacillus cycloheptanicus]